MDQLVATLRNKYMLSSTFFLSWTLYIDRHDLMSQYQYWSQLNKLESEKPFYTKEIKKTREDLNELNTNPHMLEKFARERYLMKKENEDIFVIVKESSGK